MNQDLVDLWQPQKGGPLEDTLDYSLALLLQIEYPKFYELLESCGFAWQSTSKPIYEYIHWGCYNSFLNFCWDVKAPTDEAVKTFKEKYSSRFDHQTLTKILRSHFHSPDIYDRTRVWITLIVENTIVYDQMFEKAALEHFGVNAEPRYETGDCSLLSHQSNVGNVPRTDSLFQFLQEKTLGPVDVEVLKDLVRAFKYSGFKLYFHNGEGMKHVVFTITFKHSEVTPVDEVLVDDKYLGLGDKKAGKKRNGAGKKPRTKLTKHVVGAIAKKAEGLAAAFADLS